MTELSPAAQVAPKVLQLLYEEDAIAEQVCVGLQLQ